MTLLLLLGGGPLSQEFETDAPGGVAVVYGPRRIGVDSSSPNVRFWLFEPGLSWMTWTNLTKVTSFTAQEDVSEVGALQVTVQNDDPQLPNIDGEKMIGVEVYGGLEYAGVVGGEERKSIAREGPEGESTTYSMKGAAKLLDEGVVAPSRGADQLPVEKTRAFNWANPLFPDGSWGQASEMAPRVDPVVLRPPYLWGDEFNEVWPVGLLEPNTKWIWSSIGTQYNAPPGTCLFRGYFEVPSGESFITIRAGFDNYGDLYLDGQLIWQGVADFRKARVSDPIPITPGVHLIAAICTNSPDDGPPGDNPGALAAEVHASDRSGNPTTLLLQTDASWKILPYITELPGMPIGMIIRMIVQEAQARGALEFIKLGFSDYYDSDGRPWPVVGDVSTNVGRTVFDFLHDLAQTYIDFRVEPATLTLRCWNKYTMGTARSASFHRQTDPSDPSTGNLTELTHRRSW